jgi:hypothetical protein
LKKHGISEDINFGMIQVAGNMKPFPEMSKVNQE